MRFLDQNEQNLCLRILEGDGDNNYLGNIIDDKLDGVRISLNRHPPTVTLLYTIQNQMPTEEERVRAIERVREISIEILVAVNLINLFAKEGYIMLLQRTTRIDDATVFGRGIANLPSIPYNFSDPEISRLLLEYSVKEIFVTEEFRQFCAHDFIARDEQRYRWTIRIATIALFITSLALVANVFFNLLPKFTGGTQIKQEQIDSIRNDLKSTNLILDSINGETKRRAANIFEELKKMNEKGKPGKKNKNLKSN